ncbi:MAG TPA: hypothetical protein VFV34_15450, partial [Blastocatellia bacterium]|nr:hypothetical protein [Blastocatellia bacterium]
ASFLPRPNRTKVSLEDSQLLQCLVFTESEHYERERERHRGPGQPKGDDMVISFIKHLVSITVRRNSFHVALGISRLLHNYSTAETREIYDVVIQDPDRTKDENYCRARKALLMQEIKQRFGDLITVCRGARGEERFESNPSQGGNSPLVRECLDLFAPWGAPCPVPCGFNPQSDVLGLLSFADRDLDEEHRTEVNRIHAVIHSGCFTRLTQALGLDSPDTRLAIPHFAISRESAGDDGLPPSGRSPSPKLDVEDVAAINAALADQSSRRKAASSRLLRVFADGVERAAIDRSRSDHVMIELLEGDALVEVRSNDEHGTLLLATYHHRPHQIRGNDTTRTIILEGGQKIAFRLSKDSSAGSESWWLDISFRDPVSMSFQNGLRSLQTRVTRFGNWLSATPKPVGVVILALVAALAAWLYWNRGAPSTPKPDVVESDQTGVPPDNKPSEADAGLKPEPRLPETAKPSDGLGRAGSEPTASRSKQAASRGITARGGTPGEIPDSLEPEDSATREIATKPAPVALTDVRRVYVECAGTDSLTQLLCKQTEAAIDSGGPMKISSRLAADAALKIVLIVNGRRDSRGRSVKTTGAGEDQRVSIRARLVNRRGQVIWPASGDRAEYSGLVKDVVAVLIRDLTSAK